MAIPAEIYSFGWQFALLLPAIVAIILTSNYLFIPVFYNNSIDNCYAVSEFGWVTEWVEWLLNEQHRTSGHYTRVCRSTVWSYVYLCDCEVRSMNEDIQLKNMKSESGHEWVDRVWDWIRMNRSYCFVFYIASHRNCCIICLSPHSQLHKRTCGVCRLASGRRFSQCSRFNAFFIFAIFSIWNWDSAKQFEIW